MHQRAQDAMSYVRKFGRPTYFITQTTNPKWKEVTDELYPNQSAHHRPDVVARVFRLKKNHLMKLLTKKQIFGKCLAHVCAIEWQKRGLPHAHILLWISPNDQPRGNVIDNAISAELPDPAVDPILHNVILTHMTHGPCGALNPSAPCMIDGVCSKMYPKEFTSATESNIDGYPKYRRRSPDEGGITATKTVKGQEFSVINTWIVPHNSYLSRTFECHLNVELCSSVQAIFYVIKYVNKGEDSAVFTVDETDQRDEIKLFQSARYVSCSEACWRLFGFPIHEHYPPVVTLQVHLQNGQREYFTEETAETVADGPPKKTSLTAFFDLCANYANAEADTPIKEADKKFVKTLLYSSVPEFFIFKKSAGKWRPRKEGASVFQDGVLTSFRKSHSIGRMYTIHPKQSECFFLRLILHHKRAPTSFQDILTINGVLSASFREACLRSGLLQSDNHWLLTMQDAALCGSPSSLRALFAILLTACNLSDPLCLWNQMKDSLAYDILHRTRLQTQQPTLTFNSDIYNESLRLIEDVVVDISGQTLPHYSLPTVNRQSNSVTISLLCCLYLCLSTRHLCPLIRIIA